MNELIKVGERTYYISGPFHVGVYDLGTKSEAGLQQVCLIDSGVDSTVARVIDKRMMEAGFCVKMIINTHYHADHTGGNDYFKKKYDCPIYSTKMNAALISNYDICPAIVWGAKPIDEIMNNYFYATPTEALDIDDITLPEGLELIELNGHSLSQIGVRTSDDVLFLGDVVISKETIDKHPLTYIYDPEVQLKTLEALKKVKASLYVPYHAEPVKKIRFLCDYNIKCMEDNIALIKEICSEPRHLDEIISMFYNRRGLKLSLYKYAVEGGIIRTYLTYLYNKGELTVTNENNYIKWENKKDVRDGM
ncbi:MAG: MBL fold metallo-hydrolase [Lachnospiraceae bacterium]|nr:MBL fold metallo-hydrolase [Lachnospiraceae bacterium]